MTLGKTCTDGTVIWKLVKRVPDPPVYTASSLNVYTKSQADSAIASAISSLESRMNSKIAGYLPLTGGTITGNLIVNGTITGKSTLAITGATTLSSNATISGTASIGGALNVTGVVTTNNKVVPGSIVIPSAQGSGNFWIA